MSKKLIVYGTPVCPMVTPVRSTLKRASVEYDYVNIWQDDAAREQVRSINNGNESVPTLIFPDGTTLTEPSNMQLESKLQALGFTVASPTLSNHVVDFLRSPTFRIAAMVLATFAIINSDVTQGVVAVSMGLLSYVLLPLFD